MIRKHCKMVLSLAAAMMSFLAFADKAAAKAAKRFATGGEVTSFRYADAAGVGWTAFVHTFTNTADAAEFKNRSGKTLPVRYLVVGGGGAGMDGYKGTPSRWVYGGGGGGGGGVTETNALLSVGDVWTIRVGAGGGIPNSHSYQAARYEAGASSVSNGVVELVLTPGGGAGGSRTESIGGLRPTIGAAGGGGSGEKQYDRDGTNGVYTSSTFISEGIANPSGGRGGQKTYGGGGGGAGANGSAATGGKGLTSDITGEEIVYGSGGGGGGFCRGDSINAGGVGGDENAGFGGTGDGSSITKATNPVANTGSGGAGGISFGGDAYSAFDDTYAYGTSGADGVVIIRYDIPDTPCVGGDVVTVTTNGFRVTYIHKFTNTTEAATFKPSVAFDGTSVRLLAVGGGGAGMDGLHGKPSTVQSGGGGGGGGGVTETNALLSVGDVWTIHVGAGGSITNHAYYSNGTLPRARGEASASSVSNGIVELVLTPGGGAGGSRSIPPTPGAAGGGGSGKESSELNGADGEYSSSIAGVVPEGAPFAGGKGAKNTYGGGGGGAGSAGKAATGGEGLSSDITGEAVVYGSGGGGGGCFRLDKPTAVAGGNGGENAGNGGTGASSDNNLTITPATANPPAPHTGSGGGGGVSFGGSTNDGDLADELAWGTSGADGVVIIRYEADLPHPKGLMVVFH